MRYAVISDLHANRQAVKAVLADINTKGVDEIICLGDVVGYGPSPVEVLDLVQKKVHHFILGNHDAVVAGYMSPENFNDNAKHLIEWTCSTLDSAACEFFQNIPLLLIGDNVRYSHGEFENPGRFGYVIEDEEALNSFQCCNESLLVTGHSHVPGLFVIGNSGTPHWLPPQNFGLEEGKRYIVNVGSVGQPRDNDVRASYCIFDDKTKDIYFQKVSFDIAAYRDDLVKQSLPQISYFLTLEPSMPMQTASVSAPEEPVDFVPLSMEDTVKITTEVKDLQKTVTELKKAKIRLLMLVLLLLGSLGVFSVLFVFGVFSPNKANKANKVYEISSVLSQISPDLRALNKGKNLLKMPNVLQVVTKESPLDEWTVVLADPKKQQVLVVKNLDTKDKEENVFAVSSAEPALIEIASLPIAAKKGMRFKAVCNLKRITFKSGMVALLLQKQNSDGTWDTLDRKEPANFKTTKGWTRNTPAFTYPKGVFLSDCIIRLVIRSRFEGEFLIRRCALKRQ